MDHGYYLPTTPSKQFKESAHASALHAPLDVLQEIADLGYLPPGCGAYSDPVSGAVMRMVGRVILQRRIIAQRSWAFRIIECDT